MFNNIVTTMDAYENDTTTAGGIIDTRKQKGALKEWQKVIAVGSSVRDIKVGDIVCINPIRYAQYKNDRKSLKDAMSDNPIVGFNFNVVQIEDEDCLMIYDQDVRYVIEEYEEIPDPKPSEIIHPNTDIII